MLHLLTLLLLLFLCLALREMSSSGVYKLDDGKPFLNNCFPAKNLLRTPEEGQVLKLLFASQPPPALDCVSHPCLFVHLLDFCSLPHSIPSLPVLLPPKASGSLLKCASNHCVPFCSVTSRCWIRLHLLFCLQSLTSLYPVYNPIPLFMPPFHSAVISRNFFFICSEHFSPHPSYPNSSHPTPPRSSPTSSTRPVLQPSVPVLSYEPSSSLYFWLGYSPPNS